MRQGERAQIEPGIGTRSPPRLTINVGSKLLSEVAGRGLHFLLIYFAQRALGPAAYGSFTYALAAGFVFATVADLGLQLTLTREIARQRQAAARVTGVGLSVKLALTALAAALLVAFSVTRPPGLRLSTFLLGLAMLCISVVELVGHVFRGFERVDYEAGLLFLLRASIVVLGAIALALGWGVHGLALAYLAGAVLALAIGVAWLRARCFIPRVLPDPTAGRRLLRQALPLGGAILFSVLYTRTAIFLLETLRDAGAVGFFGVAQKLTEPLALLPAALMAGVFPALTRSLADRDERGLRLLRRSLALLTLAGAAIAAFGVGAGPWLIAQLYGPPYAGAAVVLQILSVAVPLTFINYVLTHVLLALERQALNLAFNLLLFLVNAPLCLALIPRHGPAGAAAAMLASELLLLALCAAALYAHRRTR